MKDRLIAIAIVVVAAITIVAYFWAVSQGTFQN